MTYFDWVRVVNALLSAVLLVTLIARYVSGKRKVDPRNLVGDPTHIALMRMGQILLYAALVEGFAESIYRHIPGGPRSLAPLPGLCLMLLAVHWSRAYGLWRRVQTRVRRDPR